MFPRHTPSKIAIALSFCFGSIPLTQAAINTGEVQVQGKTTATDAGFFLKAPTGTVNDIPKEKLNKIQIFNKNATQGQTEITPGQMQMLTPTDSFTQALANLPNVVVESSGDSQNGDDVYINGFNKSLINWTLDGIPLNDSDNYSFYSNEFIPTRLISGTRYFPGAASAALPGLAAFGGAVETYTLNPGQSTSVSLLTGYGSFGKYNYGALINSGMIGAQSAMPTAFWLYANKNHSKGFFEHTPSDQKQFLFKSISQIGPGALTLFYSRNDQNFNYYGGCQQSDLNKYGESCNTYRGEPMVNGKPNPNSYLYRFNQYNNSLGYAKYEATFGKTTVSNQVYYYRGNGYSGGASTYSSSFYDPATNTVQKVSPPTGSLFTYQSINDTKRWGNIFRLNTPLADQLGLEAGLWYNHNDTTHDRQYFNATDNQYIGSLYVEPVVTKLFEPYFNLTWKVTQDLTLQGGVKYLKVNRDFTNLGALAQGKPGQFNVDFTTTMPSLGLNYRINSALSAYANVTLNTQPPQYNQFYSGSYNPSLAPQKARTYDIGLVYDTGLWSGGLDLFRVNFDNYILSTKTNNQDTQLQNAGSAINEGLAWQNNFKLNDTWSLYANLGLLNARLTSLDRPYPYAPRHTLAVGGMYNAGPWRATLGMRTVGKSFYVFSNGDTAPINAHTLVDASLHYTLDRGPETQFGLHKLTVALNARNLLNQHYTNKYGGKSTNPYLYRNQPRSVYLSLEAQF